MLATCDEWQFDAFQLAEATQGHPLSALAFYLIHRQGLLLSLKLDGVALARSVPCKQPATITRAVPLAGGCLANAAGWRARCWLLAHTAAY